MKQEIIWYVIPNFKHDYAVTSNGVLPVKVFPVNEIGQELKKTPNVFRHPDEDLPLAFSYPRYFKPVDVLSIETIIDGASLMKSVAYSTSDEYQINECKFEFNNEQNFLEVPEPEIFPDQTFNI